MKKLYLILFLSVIFIHASAQVFWTEDFGTGCNTGSLAGGHVTGNGTWTETDISAPAPYANEWYISGHTSNSGVGNCAAACSGTSTNQTLHVGNVAIPAIGLAAEEGSYLTGLFCGLGYCSTTHKRIESPFIDCTGKTGISLSCLYYEGGDVQGGTNGDCSIWYYDGLTWSVLDPLAKTLNSACATTIYGVWNNYSITLPASADNNANVKLGFQWDNDDNSAGTDPSAAFDDITLSTATAALPVAGFTSDVNFGCDSFCVTFTDTSLNGTSVLWDFPGGTPSTSTSSTQVVCYSTPGNFDVTLYATNAAGTDTLTSTGYISAFETPVPDFSVDDQNLCAGDCVSFTDLSTGGVATYTWTFAGAVPLNSNQQNPSFICYQNPGDFSVTLTVDFGPCSNSITRVAYINVNQPAVPTVTVAGDTLISSPALTYQWYELSSGAIGAGIFQSYIATQSGDYYVCTQDAAGCSACSDTVHLDLSGIHEVHAQAFEVYPSPVKDVLTVKVSASMITGITILDVLGKNILSATPRIQASAKSIDVTQLASGVYWIEIETPGKIFRSKFAKE